MTEREKLESGVYAYLQIIPCPKCDGEMQHKKSWELRGKRTPDSKKTLMCHLYKCEKCGSTLRFPRIEERGGKH